MLITDYYDKVPFEHIYHNKTINVIALSWVFETVVTVIP